MISIIKSWWRGICRIILNLKKKEEEIWVKYNSPDGSINWIRLDYFYTFHPGGGRIVNISDEAFYIEKNGVLKKVEE